MAEIQNRPDNSPNGEMTIKIHDPGDKKTAGRNKKRNKVTSAVTRLIKNHFGSTTYHRSEAQLRREKYLIPRCVPFSRWYLIPAAFMIQFCGGTIYAWSIYNEPIEKYMYDGATTNTAAITFYLAIGGLGIAAAIFGPWLERNGPMKTAYLGTCGFFIGNLLAGLSVYTKQMWLLYLGYGVLGGLSIGVCYISPVSALQKFFPDRRGLASGCAVCGFGAGSIAASPMQRCLIDTVGVPLTFVVLGSGYFLVMALASAVLRTPPPGYTVRGLTIEGVRVVASAKRDNKLDSSNRPPPILKMTLTQSLRSRDFWLMFGMFFGNVVTGLVVISHLASMVDDIFGKTKIGSTMVVSVTGGLNLVGRFFFSLISDKIGRKTVFLLTLGTQAIIVGCMHPILTSKPDTYWAFVASIWILSACYGSSFGVIPAFLADTFGATNIGACHGVIMTGWSMACVGGGLIYTSIFKSLVPGRYTAEDSYPYVVNFYWLLAVILFGFILTLFIRTNPWHRMLANIDQRRVLYVSIGQRLLCIDFREAPISVFHLMSEEEIAAECDKRGGVTAFSMSGKGGIESNQVNGFHKETEMVAKF